MSDYNCYKLSYKFQKIDERDYIFTASLDKTNEKEIITIKTKAGTTTTSKTTSVPSFTISKLPNIIDQGQIGDCVANAFYYTVMSQTKNAINLSRLYLYANCRCIDYTPLNKDDGTTIRTACTAVLNYGVCLEPLYPHNSNYTTLPPLNAYQNAKRFKTFNYLFINKDLTSLKSALTNYNVPIIFGILVYSTFMSSAVSKTGIVPMPNTKTDKIIGGHCVCMVGYDDSKQLFKCANSWGTSWGDKGYFYLPYSYVTNPSLANDFCVTNFVF
jgi:C1A family cysteine protease